MSAKREKSSKMTLKMSDVMQSKVIKEARVSLNIKYKTSHYQQYDLHIHHKLSIVSKNDDFIFNKYDHYSLFMKIDFVDMHQVSASVRLNDLTLTRVLTVDFKVVELSHN